MGDRLGEGIPHEGVDHDWIGVTTKKKEVVITLAEAQEKAAQASNIESHPYVIWWVMNRGYVVLPQGERPAWLFASEEETVNPPSTIKR